jgi:hypothetical protein
LPTDKSKTIDPELSLIIDSWAELPDAIRAGIVAMVKASKGTSAR